MKNYIFCADLHITDSTPRYRKDDYVETGLSKLQWIVDLANSTDSVLGIAGDFFDKPTVEWKVVNRVIEILNTCKHTPIVIAGQHDMVNKVQDLSNTPLYNLWISGTVMMISNVHHGPGLYGQQFGADPPDVTPEPNSIIMIHKSVTPDEVPFFLGSAISAEEASLIYKDYKIVVAGDYHVPFYKVINGVHIINCGPMLRAEKDKRDMEPCVWGVFVEGKEVAVTQIKIPIKPADDVFDITAIEYDEKNAVTLDTSKLKELINKGIEVLDFSKIVWAVYENNEFKSLTSNDVESILSGVKA